MTKMGCVLSKKLDRRPGRPAKYPNWVREELIRQVETQPDVPIAVIANRLKVGYKSATKWVRDARNQLESPPTTPGQEGS